MIPIPIKCKKVAKRIFVIFHNSRYELWFNALRCSSGAEKNLLLWQKKYASTALDTVTVKGQITLRKCLKEFNNVFGMYTAIPYRFFTGFSNPL